MKIKNTQFVNFEFKPKRYILGRHCWQNRSWEVISGENVVPLGGISRDNKN